MLLLLVPCTSVWGQKAERGIAKIGKEARVVAPKGTWMLGGTIAYSDYRASNYSLAMINGINTNGYSIQFNPTVMAAVANNVGVGLRLGYKRGSFNLDNASLEAMGASIDVQDYKSLNQKFGGAVFGRYYIPVGNSNRFSIIGDIYASAYYGEGKLTNRQDGAIIGTYQRTMDLDLGVDFGAMAFITRTFALEATLDILSFGTTYTKQVKNQVFDGNRKFWKAHYALNLLSFRLGAYFYF